MTKKYPTPNSRKPVEAFKHDDSKRSNIPTAEFESVMEKEQQAPKEARYTRNRDLDPQLVWRGKDEQDWSDLVVKAPPLYIQEKVHPKALIEDLLRQSKLANDTSDPQMDLFGDFNGLPSEDAKTEFYQHEANWTNRMILGDSLQVMASLAEREGLRGKVQCIYLDPPYGIKFNSNFQWSTTSRDVKDGKQEHITREPEMVKAFRDTWRDGIHSYLTYLRDRLTVARDLLADSGSIFVQIGDENVHRVRALMDEVFGEGNFVSLIKFTTTSTQGSNLLPSVSDYIVWFAKDTNSTKYRPIFEIKELGETGSKGYNHVENLDGSIDPLAKRNFGEVKALGGRVFAASDLTSSHYSKTDPIGFRGKQFSPKTRYWSTSTHGMNRLRMSNRLVLSGQTLRYKRYFDDFCAFPINDSWASQMSEQNKNYVVQTSSKVIEGSVR